MKKLLLLLFVAASIVGHAQPHAYHSGGAILLPQANPLAKTTDNTDTVLGTDPCNTGALTYFYYYNDSGYIYGTNLLGNKGYAQRYDFNGADSSVQVWGVVGYFTGRYTPATTKTITFSCWSQDAQSTPLASRPHFINSGAPGAALAQSNTLSIANIGIDVASPTSGTPMLFYFSSPSTPLTNSFFVGFELAYTPTALNGDTITLIVDGYRQTPAPYTISGADTIYSDWNTIEAINGDWFDAYAATGLQNDFFLYPLLITHTTTGFKGVTKNNLTWFGNYPNPANANTNIKYALATTANVTVEIMDMNGRKLDVITQANTQPGTHELPYNTSKLPAGDYIYVIHTNAGDGMAGKLSVVR